jgi:acetylornithine deacetylase/succinyl-diaminopimelate desuccinylase-like protein
MSPVAQLLRDLIAIPSINPAFTAPDHPLTGEHRVAQHLLDIATRAGLEAKLSPVLPSRPNLIVRLKPKGKVRSRILLAPHLDTVTIQDESQLKPVLQHGRLYGRGACDTKGSVAAMFTAVLRLTQGLRRPEHTEINFVGLVDEENGQSGSRALARQKFRSDFAIVGEPTCLKVITAHKGDLWLRAETHGRAAHSSQPELGENAIESMAKVVTLLQGPYARQLKKRRHPLLGAATVNVGMITGGKQPNIVPDQCEIRVDRRTLPGEKDSQIIRELGAFLKSQGCDVRLKDWKGVPSVALETDPELPPVKRLMSLAGQTRPAGVNYFSDAGVLGQADIPSVVFGPGDIAQAHTIDEWIAIRQLEQGTDLLTKFLEGLD